jgi:hypothetical protein
MSAAALKAGGAAGNRAADRDRRGHAEPSERKMSDHSPRKTSGRP